MTAKPATKIGEEGNNSVAARSDEGSFLNVFRPLRGVDATIGAGLLIFLPVLAVIDTLQLYTYFIDPLWREQFTSIYAGLILAATFIYSPARRGAVGRVPWYDYFAAAISIGVAFYLAIYYPELILYAHSSSKAVLGLVTTLLVMEGCRRLVGWPIIIICVVFILYARFSGSMPGWFYGTGMSWTHLLSYLLIDTQSLLGAPLQIATTVVMTFLLMGEILRASGGADFINNFAVTASNKTVGGPAKAAVLSSGMMGMVSGSGVADCMMTGSVTIPLMRKAGFRRNFAGAVEAVASAGGPLMPPVMGAAAFIMADFLSVPYAEIAAAALIPAILYYLGLLFQIDLEARRYNIKPLEAPADGPALGTVILREAWMFVVPIAVLIGALFALHLLPENAALWAAGSSLLIWILRGRFSILAFFELIAAAGKAMLTIGVLCAAAGLLMGAVSASGLGTRLPLLLIQIGGGSILLLSVVVALACIVLGMGLPATAIYVLLATLVAPSMVQLGVAPIAAHLFVFYYGTMSLITPPVALSAYAAATISGGDPMKTGWEACRLGIIAYLVPFTFIFAPTLLLQGATSDIAFDVAKAVAGIFLLSVSFVGYFLGPIGWLARLAVLMAALLIFVPANGFGALGWWPTAVGIVIATLFIIYRIVMMRRSAAATLEATPATATRWLGD